MPVQNRLTQLLQSPRANLLTLYFTAGFPQLPDTLPVLEALAQHGADIIEIGMPFSDPIADGPTIQQSNQRALENGMNIARLFEQLADFRQRVPDTPVLLMGYLNPVLQFGLERFCAQAAALGIDGLILPDLPMREYQTRYRGLLAQHQLSHIFLITPETSADRIRTIDAESEGFIYAVSSSSTTGKTQGLASEQIAYFERLQKMQLKNPFLVGFGISEAAGFRQVCQYARGGIIGSAFIRALEGPGAIAEKVKAFMDPIKG
ncbi:MAG: tryptophan synthase subunit alpha [Microscillaceae bacterium]|nr:tryptophan synthase subunit alpha [Microscillaceae bacterium]